MDYVYQGICVNVVCFNEVNMFMFCIGFVICGLDFDVVIEMFNVLVFFGCIVEVEDIVDVVIFLVFDDVCYMCGVFLEVNGGKFV